MDWQDEFNPEQDAFEQYKSVKIALDELQTSEQSYIIESNGAKRSVTKADYAWLVKRESTLLARLMKFSGRASQRFFAGD